MESRRGVQLQLDSTLPISSLQVRQLILIFLLQCCNTAKGDEVVATWRRSTWALTKDGQLLISPGYVPEAELILATALALEGKGFFFGPQVALS